MGTGAPPATWEWPTARRTFAPRSSPPRPRLSSSGHHPPRPACRATTDCRAARRMHKTHPYLRGESFSLKQNAAHRNTESQNHGKLFFLRKNGLCFRVSVFPSDVFHSYVPVLPKPPRVGADTSVTSSHSI